MHFRSSIKPFAKSSKAVVAALAVAASLGVASSTAMAAIVCGTANLPAAVPQTTAGVYINFVTGVTGITSASTPGWDFNPWGSTALQFFASAAAGNTTAMMGGGTAATTPTVLAAGAPIGPAGTFSTANGTNTAWHAGIVGGFVGVRFNNEATTTTHYGWARMNTTAPAGHPAQVVAYCYENVANTAINAGTTPVSLQQFSVE